MGHAEEEGPTTTRRTLGKEEVAALDQGAHPGEDRSHVRPIGGEVTIRQDEHGNLDILVRTLVWAIRPGEHRIINVRINPEED